MCHRGFRIKWILNDLITFFGGRFHWRNLSVGGAIDGSIGGAIDGSIGGAIGGAIGCAIGGAIGVIIGGAIDGVASNGFLNSQ